jgi:preprotein translocase subunit SecG
MGTLITILTVIAAILLVIVVLIQNPKGGGLSSSFGSAHQLGGVRKTTDALEKGTWFLAIAVLVLSLVAPTNGGKKSNSRRRKSGHRNKSSCSTST